jgi:prepilin-type N-terminal cleavage/methylation domain-containing protein
MNRPGVSLLELLAAMTLGAILAAVLGGALVAQLRLARHTADRALSADALRTAGAVLSSEIRRATPADVRATASDSLALRAFRGLARPCRSEHDQLFVRYRGDRLPDPRKDSLLIVTGSGGDRAFAILDVRRQASVCPDSAGEAGLRLRLSAPPPPGLGLVFESGSYYVSARAVRYRLGAEGRQPLTAEAFVPGSGFTSGHHGIGIDLRTFRGDVRAATAFFAP